MYGLQVDQLATALATSPAQANKEINRWTALGLALRGVRGPGARWVWLTQAGLQACGYTWSVITPSPTWVTHLRAVTAVRLALEASPEYRDGGATWRSEREMRSCGRISPTEHMPDGEVHWPAVPDGQPEPAWAGECWAIEAEVARKDTDRTIAIMQEVLGRTADYDCPPGQSRVAGEPPRYTRVLYLCSHAAAPTVRRARVKLGPGLAPRVTVRMLPEGATVPEPPQ